MKIAEHLTKPISKILKLLLRRLVFVTVAIILQMIWMTYMVVVIGEYSKAIEWVFRIFSITVVIYIANKDDNPAYKLAWTIPILLFPIFGGFLYLVLGDKQPAKKLRMELEQSIFLNPAPHRSGSIVINNLSNHQCSNFHLECISKMFCLHQCIFSGILFIDFHMIICDRIDGMINSINPMILTLNSIIKIAVSMIIIYCQA